MEKNLNSIQQIIKKNNQNRNKILTLYFIFFISFMITLVPFSIASIFAFMICVCTLSVIYSIRSRAEEDSVLENQMTLLIRTFWRANLYLLISFTFGLGYLMFCADYLPLKPCLAYIERHGVSILMNNTESRLMRIISSCQKPFLAQNFMHLVISGSIAFAPILGYLFYRIAMGILALLNNKLIPLKKL